MSAPASSWIDWASGERLAGQPIDVIFMGKWKNRDAYLAARQIPSVALGGVHTFVAATAWEDASWGGSKTYIPHHADIVHARFVGDVDGSGSDPTTEFWWAGVRARLSDGVTTYYSEEVLIRRGCKLEIDDPEVGPVCSGVPPTGWDGLISDLGPFEKEAILELPASLRGKTIDFQWEVRRAGVGTTSVTIESDPFQAGLNRPWFYASDLGV